VLDPQIIFAGVLLNLDIYFQPTSLFNTLIILVLFVGGNPAVTKTLEATGIDALIPMFVDAAEAEKAESEAAEAVEARTRSP
jgi:hypothetical protein